MLILSGWCSTPYGIKGRITGSAGPSVRYADVLNALRHQRKNHRRRVTSARRCLCSTPYGIKGRITSADARSRRSVLNALRHQRKNHAAVQPVPRSSGLRAQRLTASTEESPSPICSIRQLARCSTPYGIKGRITALAPSPDGVPSYVATFQASSDKRRQELARRNKKPFARSSRKVRTPSRASTCANPLESSSTARASAGLNCR